MDSDFMTDTTQSFCLGFVKAAMSAGYDQDQAVGILKQASYDDPGYLRRWWSAANLRNQYSHKSAPFTAANTALSALGAIPGIGMATIPADMLAQGLANNNAEEIVSREPSWGNTLGKSLMSAGIGGLAGVGGGMAMGSLMGQSPLSNGSLDLAKAFGLAGAGVGGIAPIVARAFSATTNPNANKRTAHQAQKHPILNSLPLSSFFNAAYA